MKKIDNRKFKFPKPEWTTQDSLDLVCSLDYQGLSFDITSDRDSFRVAFEYYMGTKHNYKQYKTKFGSLKEAQAFAEAVLVDYVFGYFGTVDKFRCRGAK